MDTYTVRCFDSIADGDGFEQVEVFSCVPQTAAEELRESLERQGQHFRVTIESDAQGPAMNYGFIGYVRV